MAPRTERRLTLLLMLDAVPYSSPNIFATREIWSFGGIINEIMLVPFLNRRERKLKLVLHNIPIFRIDPPQHFCTIIQNALIRNAYPLAASRLCINFLILHCSTDFSSSVFSPLFAIDGRCLFPCADFVVSWVLLWPYEKKKNSYIQRLILIGSLVRW